MTLDYDKMTHAINNFCSTKKISYLDGLSEEEKKEIQRQLKNINNSSINSKLLYSYFNVISIPTDNLTFANWCKYFSNLKISEQDKTTIFYNLYLNVINKGIHPDLKNLKSKDLYIIFNSIDSIYFKNQLRNVMGKNNKLELKLTKGISKTAGYCEKRKCVYTIALGHDVHISPFSNGQTKQKTGGVLCYSPLECLLHTFLHELVHLFIMIFCPSEDIAGGHSRMFKKIVFALAGHTDIKHSFGRDENVKRVTKSSLKLGQTIYFKTSKEGEIEGTITKIKIKTVDVEETDVGVLWNVHMEDLYIK